MEHRKGRPSSPSVALLGLHLDANAFAPPTAAEFLKRFAAPRRVLALRDGKGVGRRGTMAGRAFDLGPSALLELDGAGLRVVVGSLRRQRHEPRMLGMHGAWRSPPRAASP